MIYLMYIYVIHNINIYINIYIQYTIYMCIYIYTNTYTIINWDLFQECNNGSISTNQCDIPH